MHEIEAERSLDRPPEWAVLERQVFDLLNGAIDPIVEDYFDEDGSPLWPPDEEYVGIDGHDDLYEGFYNWPLVYAMGGDEKLLDESKRAWEAIVEHCSNVRTPFGHPMVVEEYEQCRDWFHQGEANLLLYNLGLADPRDERFAERAERFAGFYLPDSDTGNYDGERKLVRAPQTGSMGPEYSDIAAFDEQTSHRTPTLDVPSYGADLRWEDYGSPFHDVPELDSVDDLKDPGNHERLLEVLNERCSRGDVPQNLAITSLMTHAYLYTGEDRYREWVTEYVEAWMDRTEENDGIVPDNVGRSGEIGEYTDGKWYGGFHGWSWSGWHRLGAAITVAAENATLLEDGDPSYLGLPRSQLDVLMDRGVKVSSDTVNDTLYIPHKYGDPGDYHYKGRGDVLRENDGEVLWRDGWYEFKPLGDEPYPMHLWYASMDPEDRRRLRELRNYDRKNWKRVDPRPPSKHSQHDYAWLSYLDGEFPSYPERILEATHAQVQDRLEQLRRDDREPGEYDEMLRRDDRNPAEYDEDYLRHRNPISEEGLLQLTMGAPNQVYYGGLLMARVRHFDYRRERPGLPDDVAALVEGVDSDGVTLTLVNLGGERKELVVQAGAYGEHEFTRLRYDTGDGQREITPDANAVRVSMPGGTRVSMRGTTERFANDPTYDLPWGA